MYTFWEKGIAPDVFLRQETRRIKQILQIYNMTKERSISKGKMNKALQGMMR